MYNNNSNMTEKCAKQIDLFMLKNYFTSVYMYTIFFMFISMQYVTKKTYNVNALIPPARDLCSDTNPRVLKGVQSPEASPREIVPLDCTPCVPLVYPLIVPLVSEHKSQAGGIKALIIHVLLGSC